MQGSYLQHIHATSGAVVTLRGRNSGYLEQETAMESTEPMHIHLKLVFHYPQCLYLHVRHV